MLPMLRPAAVLLLATLPFATRAAVADDVNSLLPAVQTLGAQATSISTARESGILSQADVAAHAKVLAPELDALARRMAASSLGEDRELQRKLTQVKQQITRLLAQAQAGGAAHRAAAPEAMHRLLGQVDERRGGRCSSAQTLHPNQQLSGMLRAGGELWLRFSSEEAGLYALDSAGSRADTKIEVFGEECPVDGATASTSDDDSDGLAALAVVKVSKPQPILMRLSNLGAAAEFTLVAEATGAISGHVYDERNGAPLAGSVSVYSTAGDSVAGAYADASGFFTVSVPAGNYFVRGRGDYAFVDELYPDAPCRTHYGFSDCAVPQAQAVVVTDNQITNGIDFHLNIGGRLMGRVRTVGASPLAQAEVRVFDANGDIVTNSYVDAVGRFAVSGLLTGNYYVQAAANGYGSQLFDHKNCLGPLQLTCYPLTGEAIAVVRDQDRLNIDFDLPRQAAIRGHVTLLPTDGQASTCCAKVVVLDSNGVVELEAYVQADGSYVAGPLPLGNHYVQAVEGGHFNQLFDGIDCYSGCAPLFPQATMISLPTSGTQGTADFVLKPYRSLEGKVLDAGSGAPLSASLELRSASGVGIFYRSANTDDSGNYRFGAVPPGDYYVIAYEGSHRDIAYPNTPCESPYYSYPFRFDCDPSGATPVHVGAQQDVTGINFSLQRNASVSGHVRYRIPGSSNLPVEAVTVYLISISNPQVWGAGQTDSHGDYVLVDVPPGTYYAVLESNSSLFSQAYAGIDCQTTCGPAGAQQIVLNAGQQRVGVDFDPISKNQVVGRVVDALDGHGLGGVVLDLWNASDSTRAGSRFSNAEGYFLLGRDAFYYGTDPHVWVSTDAGAAYIDEVFDNRSCPLGAVYYGLCSLTGATALVLPSTTVQPVVANFALMPRSEQIFRGGFE